MIYKKKNEREIMNQNNVKKRLFGECWNPRRMWITRGMPRKVEPELQSIQL